jgi:hypothetical protein
MQVRRTDGRQRTNPFGGTDASRASVDPRPAEGRAPGRRKPRRAGRRREGEIPTRLPHRSEGGNPWSEAPPAKACGSQSPEGRRTSRGVPISGRASPGGRNPGSAPGGDTREITTGGRRRGRQERRGRNVTWRRQPPGVVARRGTVALWGHETSGERCIVHSVRASPGQTVERGRSLREAGRLKSFSRPAPGLGAARWEEPRSGRAEPMRRQGPGMAPGGRIYFPVVFSYYFFGN